jgi:hypothetical protein
MLRRAHQPILGANCQRTGKNVGLNFILARSGLLFIAVFAKIKLSNVIKKSSKIIRFGYGESRQSVGC